MKNIILCICSFVCLSLIIIHIKFSYKKKLILSSTLNFCLQYYCCCCCCWFASFSLCCCHSFFSLLGCINLIILNGKNYFSKFISLKWRCVFGQKGVQCFFFIFSKWDCFFLLIFVCIFILQLRFSSRFSEQFSLLVFVVVI